MSTAFVEYGDEVLEELHDDFFEDYDDYDIEDGHETFHVRSISWNSAFLEGWLTEQDIETNEYGEYLVPEEIIAEVDEWIAQDKAVEKSIWKFTFNRSPVNKKDGICAVCGDEVLEKEGTTRYRSTRYRHFWNDKNRWTGREVIQEGGTEIVHLERWGYCWY